MRQEAGLIVFFRRRLLLLALLFLFFSNKGSAQNFTLTFNDKVTGQPVEFAHITLTQLNSTISQKHISDAEGKVELTVNPPFRIQVSGIGFKDFNDTITHAADQVILLSPQYYQLDDVVVTGQFRAQSLDKSIYKIDLIDQKQFNLKAANNLGDLLRNELKFQYRTEGVLGDFLRIRGLTGEHIKILIDGMPVTGRVADKIELGQLGLQNVERVEIIEGPVSVVYGSNSLAGAINIITNRSKQPGMHGGLSAYYESVGVYNFDLNLRKTNNHHSFSANLSRNFHSGWGPIDTSRYKIWKPKLQYFGALAYQYRKKNFNLHLQSEWMNEELRDNDSLSLENLYERALDAYHYTSRWNNRFSLVKIYNEDFIINFQAGHSYYEKRKITYLNDLVNLEKTIAENDALQDTTHFHLLSARAYVSNQTGSKFEYQTGLDYAQEWAKGKRTGGSQQIADLAGFLNLIYRPYKIISLQPGVRYVYNSKYKAPLIYALNVKFNPGKLTIRSSWAKGFRAPSLKQLYLEFIDNNHEIYGNPDLDAETGKSFSFAADYLFTLGKQNLKLKADAFHNTIENAIQLAIDTENPGWGTYFNVSENPIITKGLEFNAEYHWFPRFNIKAGWITTGQNKLNAAREFSYSQDFTTSVQYYSPKFEYEIALFYKYTGDYLEYRGNFNEAGELYDLAQRKTSGYHSMDLTFNKYLFSRDLIVSLGIKNLFDVTQVSSLGNINFHGSSNSSTPVAYGRTFFVKLNYRFSKL